jgi:alpha-2-macroglobulin
MTRMLRAGLAAGLLFALAACSATPPQSTRPAPWGRVPVVLASLTTSATDAESPDFKVAEVGPSGTVPHENLDGGIWVLFTKPVVPLKALAAPAGSSTVLSLSPKIDGVYRWYGSRLLSFEPKGALAPATEYTFTVNRGLRSLEGDILKGDTKFSFRTEPLRIVSVTPSGGDVVPEAAKEIVVTFNFPVDLKTVLPFVRLEANGASVPFKAGRPAIANRAQLGPYENTDRLVSLTPGRELPRNADVVVRVMRGAKPRPENYGIEVEITESFHTLLPLQLESSDVSADRSGITAEIRFNHPLKEESAVRSVSLAVPGWDAGENLEVAGSWVFLHQVPVKYESTFAADILPGITDTYGQMLGTARTVRFEVGAAPAYVDFRATGMRILESQFPPRVAVEMQNVDSGQYVLGRMASPFAAPPNRPVVEIDTESIPRNTRHFEIFDLAPYMNGSGKGTAYLSWLFKGLFWGSEESQDAKDELVVQVTDIGASVNVGYNSILVFASSLSTGAPLTEAGVTLRKDGTSIASGRTDAAGLASLTLAPGTLMASFKGTEEKAEIEIVKGRDRLVLRPTEMPGRTWNASEPFNAEAPRPLTYLWSDRGIYRPGETLSFAGIDRDLVVGRMTPVQGKFRVDLTNGSEDSAPIATANGSVSAQGTFSGQLLFPKDAEPGDWLLVFHRIARGVDKRTGSTYVQVANFRRVAFSVALTLPDARAFAGDTLKANLSGAYLAGGAVTKGSWSWFWTRREIWYQPPGDALSSYTFGDVQKGWAEDLSSESGSISGDGTTVASQKLADFEPGRVYSYEVAGTVQDVDRQAIYASASQIAFSSEQLLGAKLTADSRSDDSLYFVTKGTPFTLKVVSVDADGRNLGSGNLSGQLIREEWQLVRERTVGEVVDTRYEKQDVVERTFTVRPGQPVGMIQLSTEKSGSYAIELSGKDRKGRPSLTRISFYSTGSDMILWQRSDERQIEIVPDKKLYKPGDTAHLLVKSPVASGSFLVSVERDGVLEKRVVELSGGAPTIDVRIAEDYIPMVYVFLATARGRSSPPADAPDHPDFGTPRGYSGLVELPVDTASRAIALSISNGSDTYRPGTDATVTVKATLNGQPLQGAEIALVAADRGVLDLINYRVPDPLDFFYSRGNFPDKVAHFDSRDMLMDPVTWKANDLPGGDEKGEAAPGGPGAGVRKNFNPTAVFRTGLVTGRDGTVSVRFRLPDQLTRFRSTAVAVKDTMFGIAEGEFVVQNPINVRAALPRRMRVGDAATAGVVLTNIDAKQHTINVGIGVQGLSVQGQQKKSITLKAGETQEVAFDLAAPAEGTAKLSFSVDTDGFRDRLEETLSVVTEHLNESFTVVGKTGDLAKEGMTVPSSFLGTPEEGLYLSLDSTIASALAGAVKFLEVYPYDCLEQVTSKLFSHVLFPTLAPGPADLDQLARFANSDGGYSYWADSTPRRSNYYVSLRVAHLLSAARTRGMKLPAGIDTEALLGYIDERWEAQDSYLQAYALYVLAAWGRDEPDKAGSLAERGDEIGVFGYGFLGLAYQAMGDTRSAQAALTRLKSFVRVGTRTVTLVGTVHDQGWYGGDIQAKALLLMLYARLQPDSQLVLGLANDLLASNASGHWENTSNAGWVLQAFSEIVTRGNEANADFTASVKLGNAEIARNRFRGFSRAPFLKQVPARDLTNIANREPGRAGPDGEVLPLTFSLSGKGTLYYTAELRYSLPAVAADPRDEGIGLATEILDGKGAPVTGNVLGLGQVYTMRVVFYSSRDRSSLALRVPLPSGAEPIDGSLLTSQVFKPAGQPVDEGDGENDQGYEGDYGENGYTTRIYDSEVRYFFDDVQRGKHEVTFLFRTTTPGLYPTPPAQAECMYQPEVFGRTGGSVYRIGR